MKHNINRNNNKLVPYQKDHDSHDKILVIEILNDVITTKQYDIRYTRPNGNIITTCPYTMGNGLKRGRLLSFNQIKNEINGYRLITFKSAEYYGKLLFYKKISKIYRSLIITAIQTPELAIENDDNNSETNLNDEIVYNAIKTPDGTIVESRHVHDYVVYNDKNGEDYMVDGGLEYLKRSSSHKENYVDISLIYSDGHEKIRNSFTWGSYGKSGKEELHYILLSEMTTEHINAILDTQRLRPVITEIFVDELEYRKKI